MASEIGREGPYTGPRHSWRVDLLARWILSRAPPGVVVDAGCGFGTLAVRLALAGRSVAAFDLDPRRVAAARAEARHAGVATQVWLVRADVARMPFADASAAAVAFGEVLEHVADDAAAGIEAARALSDGGVLALTVPAGPERFGAVDRRAGHVRRYDKAALGRLITATGLTIEVLRGWGFPFGRLYDRWVQRPALAARGARSRAALRRIGAAHGVAGLWWRLFDLDEHIPAGSRGSGWLLVARKGPAIDGQLSATGSAVPPS